MQKSLEEKKISLITVCYNSARTINDTLASVLNQRYGNVEYIIVDGLSKDNTLEIISDFEIKFLEKCKSLIWISEKDSGIYDAMNKGIRMATGDVIGILNSDDFYINECVISDVMEKFNTLDIDSLYGDILFVSEENPEKIVRRWKSSPFIRGSFKKSWHPPHPGFFVKRSIYETYGYFDTEFRIAADYELMLRFLHRYAISTYYLDSYIVKMRYGGESTKNIENINKGRNEIKNAWIKNGYLIPKLLFLRRYCSKVFQKIRQ